MLEQERLSLQGLTESLNDPNRKHSMADLVAKLSPEDRKTFLEGFSQAQIERLTWDWAFWGRPAQIMPGTPGAEIQDRDWRYWLLMAGRGFGKSRSGAEGIRYGVEVEARKWVHLVGATAADVRDVMVEGESGLLACYPPGKAPIYEPSKRKLTWYDDLGEVKAIGKTFSADEPDRLRGPQCELAWGDEIAAWKYPEAMDNLLFGLRLGADPRAIFTTTPRPVKLVRNLLKDKHTVITRGSTYDNRSNLAAQFYDSIIKKYEGTNLGRQEIYAELLDDNPYALWKRAVIEATRVGHVNAASFVRVVVAVDPAVSANEESSETGIIVAALAESGHVYILQDSSIKGHPIEWGRAAVACYNKHEADRIVAEINNGGDLVEANIRSIAPDVSYRAVRASRGKLIRAEPVAALYERGIVHHVGMFEDLEDQLVTYMPGEPSPDRMDALVWAITDLVIDREIVEEYYVEEPQYRHRY